MSDELPSTPGAAFPQPKRRKERLVELELDRRAATLDGIETETCLCCGEAKATLRQAVRVEGRFSSTALLVSLCEPCRDKRLASFTKLARFGRFVRGLSFVQFVALGVALAGGGNALLFSSLSVALVFTLGASYALKRKWLRDEPRLLELKATSVRLSAPESWARVLVDEKPRALAAPPTSARST